MNDTGNIELPVLHLPQQVEGGQVVLRSWVPDDAYALTQLIIENIDHLRPWMPWIKGEPQTVDQKADLIREWQADPYNAPYGIFFDGVVVGACGLHSRIRPGGLEIGYWVSHKFVRRGIATQAARLLTDAAFSMSAITHVEIHHDQANEASAAVPRKLGYDFKEEVKDEVDAPGKSGINCIWRLERTAWKSLA